VNVGYSDGFYFVTAKAYGEEIDPSRHDLLVDVKAVTLHKFKVEQTVRAGRPWSYWTLTGSTSLSNETEMEKDQKQNAVNNRAPAVRCRRHDKICTQQGTGVSVSIDKRAPAPHKKRSRQKFTDIPSSRRHLVTRNSNGSQTLLSNTIKCHFERSEKSYRAFPDSSLPLGMTSYGGEEAFPGHGPRSML